MFLQKIIAGPIIGEYSTISVLDYFEDTLANLGLHEYLMGWDSTDVTQMWVEQNKKTKSNPVENCVSNSFSKTE